MAPVTSANSSYQVDSSYKEIIVERHGSLMVIKFNRIASRNSFNRRTYSQLIRVLRTTKYDDDITIIVFTGVADVFCSGNDLRDTFADARSIREIAQTQGEDAAELQRIYLNDRNIYVVRTLVRALILTRKLLVALVNGPCVGIGLTFAALCDVVYCTENAYFEAPFVRLGICPEMGSSYLMERIIGRSKATELLIFGSRMTAEEALQLHFISRIYKASELSEKFWPQMKEYSRLPLVSLTTSKYVMRQLEKEKLMQALALEFNGIKKLRLSKHHMSAIEAFLNKTSKQKKSSDNGSKL